MLDIPGSIGATTMVEPGELALGESEAGPQARTLTLSNSSSSAVTYNLSHVGALSTGANTFTPAFFNAPAAAAFSMPSVIVPANGSATVSVTVTAPAATPGDGLYSGLYGGYLVATHAADASKVYRVP